jgi:hypothetical protein
MGYGLWDGVTGIFTQPYEAVREEGLGGVKKGVIKGLGGAAFKPAAGKSPYQDSPFQKDGNPVC